MICIHTHLDCFVNNCYRQFVTHLDYKIPMLIAIVIMMHVYIPIYVVIQSFLKKNYKLHERSSLIRLYYLEIAGVTMFLAFIALLICVASWVYTDAKAHQMSKDGVS